MIVPSTSGRRIAQAAFGDAVADPRVLHPAGDPSVARTAIGVANGLERPLEPDTRTKALARPGPVTGVECVPPAHLPAVDADGLRQPVEQALERERDLRDSEAAHRSAGGLFV